MWKRVILVLFMAIGAFVAPSHAQEPSNPYIYYFSDKLNAFIIERADGTDTRVLGDGLMALAGAADDIHVNGPGWSASGKWFAWTAAQVGHAGGYWSGYRPFVLSADGTRRLTLLDHLTDAQLVWTSHEDALFVASRQTGMVDPNKPDERTAIDTYLAVVDVAGETVISVVTDRTISNYNLRQDSLRPKVVQTNDGQHFIVEYTDTPGGDSLEGTVITYVFDTNGNVSEKRWYALGPVGVDIYQYPVFPSISTAGWVAYPTAESFRIENVLTNEQHQFVPLENPRVVFWDPSGQYALIKGDDLWLLDCSTATLTRVHDNLKFDLYPTVETETIWSSDGTYAILLGENGSFVSFNRKNGDLTEIPFEIGTSNSPDIMWDWAADLRPMFYYIRHEDGFSLYDLVSRSVEYLDVEFPSFTYPRLSPNERYLAYMEDGAVIYDRETATTLKLRPAYDGFHTFPGVEIIWHDSGDWLLTFDDALGAGGAHIRFLGITRADGTLQRDLGFSWSPRAITLDWLPPQVDVDDLPPAVERSPFPQPVAALRGSQWSFYVDWSPDGRWLAAGLGGGWVDESDITVWEVDTGKIVHVFEDAGNDRVMWPQGEEFVPELMAVPKDGPVLALSPDGRQSVQNTEYPDERWRTQVIDNETGSVLAELQDEWDTTFRSASFSPDGHLLITVGYPYMAIQIWDTATWELVATTPNHGQAAVFSPDGTQLAVTASWDVQIWDVDELLAFGVQ